MPYPRRPETVAGFVLHCKELGKKPATVRRYLSTIARLHRAAELFNPCASEAVQMEVKGMTNEVSSRQRQAKGLGMAEIQAFLNSRGDNLPTVRERAMLCVAYDAMTRRSELIAIDVEDLKFLGDGTGRLLIRRSKTDQAGEGHVAYLSRQTVRYLQAWLQKSRHQRRPGLSADHRARDGHVQSAGEGENRGETEPRGRGPGVQGGGQVPQHAGGRSRAGQWTLGSSRGDTGFVGVECRFGVGHARRAVDHRSNADAVR